MFCRLACKHTLALACCAPAWPYWLWLWMPEEPCIPETATLQQAMDSVAEQIVAVETARDHQMHADLNCP